MRALCSCSYSNSAVNKGVGLAALLTDPCLLGLVPVSHARAGHAVASAAGLQAEPDGTGAVVRDLALGVGDGAAADGLGAGMVGVVVYSRIGGACRRRRNRPGYRAASNSAAS